MASSERTDQASDTSASAAAQSVAGERRNAERAAADKATQMSDDVRALRFEATVNGRYHTSRQGWYEFMHRLSMFVVVIGGAGAVAEAVGQGSRYSWIVALVPTIAGTLDLVFDFSAKAAQHARLQEKSYEIIADIEQSNDDPVAVSKRGWAATARIWALEPKTMRVVQALAYNDTKQGTEKNVQQAELIGVGWWPRLMKHVWPFDGMNLDPPAEVSLRG